MRSVNALRIIFLMYCIFKGVLSVEGITSWDNPSKNLSLKFENF